MSTQPVPRNIALQDRVDTALRDPDAWDALIADPITLPDVRAELAAIIEDIDHQLVTRRGQRAWEVSCLRFRGTAVRRLAQVDTAITKATVHDYPEQVRRLAAAVAAHRTASARAGIEPEAHDEALWAVLDGESVPTGLTNTTLDHMVTTGPWRPS